MSGPAETTVGLVGCGRWGRLILRDLVSLGCRVRVVVKGDESRRNAEAGGAELVVDRIDRLPEADGFVVASPTVTHADVIEELIPRGAPIFCEKPMTADPMRARRIAEQAGGRLFVMDKWRYHPGVMALGRLVRSGELGPVEFVRTLRVQWGCPHADVDSVWILAPHDLSILIEVLGHLPKPVSAVAERSGGEVVGLVGVLGGDCSAVVEVSSRRPLNRRSVVVNFRDGVAALTDSYADALLVQRNDTAGPGGRVPAEAEHRPIGDEMPLLEELRAFVGHLRGGPPPRSSAEEGAAVVEAIGQLRALAGIA